MLKFSIFHVLFGDATCLPFSPEDYDTSSPPESHAGMFMYKIHLAELCNIQPLNYNIDLHMRTAQGHLRRQMDICTICIYMYLS